MNDRTFALIACYFESNTPKNATISKGPFIKAEGVQFSLKLSNWETGNKDRCQLHKVDRTMLAQPEVLDVPCRPFPPTYSSMIFDARLNANLTHGNNPIKSLVLVRRQSNTHIVIDGEWVA